MGYFKNKVKSPEERRWTPEFPEFSTVQWGKLKPSPAEDDIEDSDDEDTEPWVRAPSTSHLLAFRYNRASEARNDPKIKRKAKRSGATVASVIQIRFKATRSRAVTEYHYFYDDQREASSVWRLLLEAPHPGEVVLHVMIANNTPYRRIS